MEQKISYLQLMNKIKSGTQPEEIWVYSVYGAKNRFKWSGISKEYFLVGIGMYRNLRECLNEKHSSDYDGVYNRDIYFNESILDRKERKFMELLKMMRVTSVSKEELDGFEYIKFQRADGLPHTLPIFKKGTMYLGMETGKKYSLAELLED